MKNKVLEEILDKHIEGLTSLDVARQFIIRAMQEYSEQENNSLKEDFDNLKEKADNLCTSAEKYLRPYPNFEDCKDLMLAIRNYREK